MPNVVAVDPKSVVLSPTPIRADWILAGDPQASSAEVARSADSAVIEPLTTRQKIVLALTAFAFLLLAFSIVPWGSILNNVAVDPVTHESVTKAFAWELGWWLPELTALFFVMSVVVGVVGHLGESKLASTFL